MLMSPKEVDAVGDMQSSRVMLQYVNLGVEVLGDGSWSDGSRSDGSWVLGGPLWGDPPDASMSWVDIFLRITLEYRERERERKNQTLGNFGTIIQRAYRIYNISYTHKHNPHTPPAREYLSLYIYRMRKKHKSTYSRD